jgi:hypothetical protein
MSGAVTEKLADHGGGTRLRVELGNIPHGVQMVHQGPLDQIGRAVVKSAGKADRRILTPPEQSRSLLCEHRSEKRHETPKRQLSAMVARNGGRKAISAWAEET